MSEISGDDLRAFSSEEDNNSFKGDSKSKAGKSNQDSQKSFRTIKPKKSNPLTKQKSIKKLDWAAILQKFRDPRTTIESIVVSFFSLS